MMDGCPQIICSCCETDKYDDCSFHQTQYGYPPCNAMIWISVLPKLTWMISFSEWCNATTLASVLRLLQICHVFAPTLFVSRAGLGLWKIDRTNIDRRQTKLHSSHDFKNTRNNYRHTFQRQFVSKPTTADRQNLDTSITTHWSVVQGVQNNYRQSSQNDLEA